MNRKWNYSIVGFADRSARQGQKYRPIMFDSADDYSLRTVLLIMSINLVSGK